MKQNSKKYEVYVTVLNTSFMTPAGDITEPVFIGTGPFPFICVPSTNVPFVEPRSSAYHCPPEK